MPKLYLKATFFIQVKNIIKNALNTFNEHFYNFIFIKTKTEECDFKYLYNKFL